MGRPSKRRRICALPINTCFLPESLKDTPAVKISLEEYESVRLLDYEGMTQEEAARRMGVARTTVQSLYLTARKRIAGCLVEGRPLIIEGGNFELCDKCNDNRKIIRCKAQKGSNAMKIAVTYENGQIFHHFGHTEQFKIYTVEDNAVKDSHILSSNGAGHGTLATLLQEENVDTLICGGIGAGALAALAEAKIAVYGGVQGEADAAVNDFIAGKLAYDPAVHCDHHDHSEGHDCVNHGCGGHGHGHMHQHGKGYGHGGSNRTV